MKKILVSTTCALLVLLAHNSIYAETTLQKIFDQLRSEDPGIKQAARTEIVKVFVANIPTIERESGTICGALADNDPYIRLQASGMLSVLATTEPDHISVVINCTQGLMSAGSDTEQRVQLNALRALVLNSNGPSGLQRSVLETALHDPAPQLNALGAYGLLLLAKKEGTGTKAVADAIRSSTTSVRTKQLLSAVSKARLADKTLYDVAASFVYDRDADIGKAALLAAAASSAGKDQVESLLNNVSAGSVGEPALRDYAKSLLRSAKASSD